jgi:ketosteroid isomerase-like protein
MTPRETVNEMMGRFVEHMEHRDLDAVVALFRDDGVFFGSEAWEWAVGTAALRDLFSRLFARPQTYTWSGWDLPITGSAGEVIWFVMPATLVERFEGAESEFPYRLSGVLEQVHGGAWRFRMFNGSEPAPSPEGEKSAVAE